MVEMKENLNNNQADPISPANSLKALEEAMNVHPPKEDTASATLPNIIKDQFETEEEHMDE